MDRNINSDGTPVTKAIPKSSPENGIYNIVAWADREDSITFIPYDPVFCLSEKCATNTDGPITAINYLYNATKDWINIPNIDINYIDEGSNYGSIKTINGLTQITKKDGTVVTVLTDQEGYPNLKVRTPYYSEVSDLNETNEYLYEFLGGMTGYWLFSSYSDDSIGALLVSSEGSLSINIAETTNINGLRPVITLGL